MTSKSEKMKIITAFGLSYVLCLFIVWDNANRARSIKILLTTWTIALSLDAVLYVIRRRYESDRKIRLIFAAAVLVSYIIYGLIFRSMMHHLSFAMTMIVFMLVGSLFVDIFKSDEIEAAKQADNQEDAPDKNAVR